ncbi:DNA-binding protein rif1 [Entomortierella lignicola]|nr:DNA-binding protein rif1 [Entomortierella lignicola]
MDSIAKRRKSGDITDKASSPSHSSPYSKHQRHSNVTVPQSHTPENPGSPLKPKKGQDSSRSSNSPKSYRNKFERPNTRHFRSAVSGFDNIKPKKAKGRGLQKVAKPKELEQEMADSEEQESQEMLKAPIIDTAAASTPESTKSNATTDQERVELDSQEEEQNDTSVETVELSQTDITVNTNTTKIEANANALSEDHNGTVDSNISTVIRTPTTPTKESIAPIIHETMIGESTPPRNLTAPQDAPNTPSPTTANEKSLPALATPISIPAQIAVIEASSPSKRVAFSPNKQESRFSNPNSVQVSKLKGILKPAPLRIEDGDLVQGERDVTHPVSIFGTGSRIFSFSGDPSTDAESFVKTALASLESDDLQLRAMAYMELQAKIRAGDDKPYLDVVRLTMRTFATYLMRDLDSSNPPSLIQAALKCTSFYFYNQSIPTCNLAIWSFTSAKIPQRILMPFVPQMFKAFLENLDSRFKSSSITSESLSFPTEIVSHVHEWLVPVVTRLVSNVPGIRSRALELLTAAIPKLIEKEDPRKIQVVSKFMKDHSLNFFAMLTQNFLEGGDEVYAITVWGAMVTLCGRLLQKYSNLNPMLKMAEKCFNSTSQKRTEIKMAAFQAWTRLIYNFAIGGHIALEKPLRLMMTPITNCFLTERHKRVRLACTNTWIALIYALGPKLSKNADQVLFPMLKLAVADDSEHIRDLALRLIVALFSNTGGQDLVEGRQSIVPGTITFADLGWADAKWVRTELLEHGLEYIFQTISLQHKIPEASREDWKKLGLTELPLLTQRCARTWEGVVKAIRDINLQEKGMKATPEADHAVTSLLFFVERVSRCDPKDLVPKEWPSSDPEKISLLKLDPDMAGFIVRADIVHYFYAIMIDVFSARALVTTRYRVKDKIHEDIQDAIKSGKSETSPAEEVVTDIPHQESKDVTLSPLEFILKSWLATGESVIGTALEDPFWQAVAFFVEMSTKGINLLRPLYKCLDHMEDIKTKRQTTSNLIWPSYSNGPVSPSAFRIFQCKYWAIVAQRLGATIEKANEISDDVALKDQHGFGEFFSVMTYPFGILSEFENARDGLPDMDHSQHVHESQELENRTDFMIIFEETSLPAWEALLRSFYKVVQQKRNIANALIDILASRVHGCYDKDMPFVWTQSLSIAFTSVIVETVVLVDPGSSLQRSSSPGLMSGVTPNRQHKKQTLDNLLKLCSFLFEEAYGYIEKADSAATMNHIPPIQEAAFLLLEKVINKAPSSYIVHWLQELQHSIIQWIEDPLKRIRNLPKAARRLYRSRINTFWSHCVLRKLLDCSAESRIGGPRSAFGSVLPPVLSTIRSAMKHQEQVAAATRGGQVSHSPLASPSALPNPFLENGGVNTSSDNAPEIYNSETLALLTPLLLAGLNSHHKSIVNPTLEFWNKSFGLSKKSLDYPDEIVLIMRQLKLVATISLPGWNFEDSSQTEVPQFASMSQEMFSLPTELNVKSGLSRLLKEKAVLAKQLSPKKRRERLRMLGLDTGTTATGRDTTKTNLEAPLSESSGDSSSSANSSRASTPDIYTASNGTRLLSYKTGSEDSSARPMEIDEVDTEIKESNKRKVTNNRTVHSLEMDPVRRILVAKTSEASKFDSNTPEDSDDDISEVSSPSKRAKMNVEKEQEERSQLLFTTIVKKQMSPFKSRDPVEDVSTSLPPLTVDQTSSTTSTSNSIASVVHQPSTDKQTLSGESQDAFSIMPAQRTHSSSTEDAGIEEFEGGLTRHASDVSDSAMSEAKGDKSEATKIFIRPEYSIGNDAIAVEDSISTNGEIDSPVIPASVSKNTAGPSIESKEDFAVAVRRLVEARGVVNQMDMRQLHELQSQLMTLNQTVSEVWGQLLANADGGAEK